MTAFNALANGGTLIQPHIMQTITHTTSIGENVVDEVFEPKVKENVLSEEMTSVLRDYLERTVNKGGSNRAYIAGYHLGGKTGTAQKVNPVTGGYESGKYISSMAAMVPSDNPKVTVFVSIDEPSNGDYYAGVVTAPVAKILIDDIINYMNDEILKDNDSILREIVIPELRGLSIDEAKKVLKDSNLEYNIEGSGSIITDIKPYPGYVVKEGSKINLYTDGDGNYNKNVVMPDLIGYSKESAIELLESLGINYTLQGDGVVTNQSTPQGEVIVIGDTVKLILTSDYGD